MSSSTPLAREPIVYEFGPFRFRADELLLFRGEEQIALNPKTLETLRVLIENAGRLVTRDELMERVWPDTAVTDASLTQNVWLLRKALHDEEEGMLFIETLPRRGYRFVGKVSVVSSEPAAPTTTTEVTPASATTALVPIPKKSSAWLIAAIVAPLVLLAAFLYLRSRTRPDGPTAPRRSVAVFDFRNASGRPEVAWVSTALAEAIGAELAAGGELRTVPGETVAALHRELRLSRGEALSKETLARVRRATGADLVVVGSYLSLGTAGDGRVRIDVRVQDTNSGEILTTVAETVPEEQLIDVTGRIGQQLRAGLLVREPSRDGSLAARASQPSNLTASRHYALGLAALRRFDGVDAVAKLKLAVGSDPSFPLAHAALSEAFSAIGRDQDAREEILRASQLATGLPREERLQIEARQALATSDWPRAAETFKTLWRFFPDTPGYAIDAAAAQLKGSDPKGTLSTLGELQRSSLAGIDRARVDVIAAEAETVLGHFDRAAAIARQAVAEAEAAGAPALVAAAKMRESSAFENMGRPDDALRRLEEARAAFLRAGDRRNAATALDYSAQIQATTGDSSSIALLREALATFRDIGDNRGMAMVLTDLGNALSDMGDTAGARSAYEEALTLRRAIRDRKGESSVLLNMGRLEKRGGNLALAKSLYQQSLAIKREIGDRAGIARLANNLGNIASYEGDPRAAIKLYNESLSISRTTGERRSLALAQTNIAVNLLALGDLREARRYVTEALPVHRETKHVGNIIDGLSLLGLLAEAEGRFDDAMKMHQEALALAQSSKNRISEAIVLKNLASLQLSRLDGRAALAHLDACDRINGPDLAAEVGVVPDAYRSVALVMTGAKGEAARLRAKIESSLPSAVPALRVALVSALARSALLAGEVADARRIASAHLAEAESRGYGLAALDLRYVLASCETDPAKRRAALDAVRAGAQKTGYILLVREIERPSPVTR